jgi:hypothetical protein
MWNIRKYSAMAIVGVGLAFAASSPASAQSGGWGGSGWGGAYGAGGWGGSGWGGGYGGYGLPLRTKYAARQRHHRPLVDHGGTAQSLMQAQLPVARARTLQAVPTTNA